MSLGNRDGDLEFVTATDRPILQAAEVQIEFREGPCHDAFHSGDAVTTSDLAGDERWPSFSRIALGEGLHAVAGIPMLTDEQTHQRAGHLRPPAPRVARRRHRRRAALADMATGYVINAQTLTQRERLANRLQHALDSRVIIEQAKGHHRRAAQDRSRGCV